MSRVLPVPDGLAGERIDVALSRMLGLSRARVSALVDAGAVRVDARPVAKSHRLSVTETVEIDDLTDDGHAVESGDVAQPEATIEIPILWEDDHLIVIDKPVGVAVHPSPGWSGPTVTGSRSWNWSLLEPW